VAFASERRSPSCRISPVPPRRRKSTRPLYAPVGSRTSEETPKREPSSTATSMPPGAKARRKGCVVLLLRGEAAAEERGRTKRDLPVLERNRARAERPLEPPLRGPFRLGAVAAGAVERLVEPHLDRLAPVLASRLERERLAERERFARERREAELEEPDLLDEIEESGPRSGGSRGWVRRRLGRRAFGRGRCLFRLGDDEVPAEELRELGVELHLPDLLPHERPEEADDELAEAAPVEVEGRDRSGGVGLDAGQDDVGSKPLPDQEEGVVGRRVAERLELPLPDGDVETRRRSALHGDRVALQDRNGALAELRLRLEAAVPGGVAELDEEVVAAEREGREERGEEERDGSGVGAGNGHGTSGVIVMAGRPPRGAGYPL
jgi:hypothetical protein